MFRVHVPTRPIRARLSGRERASAQVLVADDDLALAEVVGSNLTALGHRVTTVSNGAAALAALRTDAFDVALLDIVMPSPDGLEVLRMLADEPDPPAVIITTGLGAIDTAVHALRLGAFAYLAKPFRMPELDLVVVRALEQRTLAHQNAALRQRVARTDPQPEFVTQYAPLRAVLASAMEAAAREAPVLIVGAPGTGKGALARAMHARSSRAARPFIELDAKALSERDVASQLFGGPRTATGSMPPAALATRGTVYLREVLALPPREQSRLARALLDGCFTVPGLADPRVVRARIIAAATTPLAGAAGVSDDIAAALEATCIVLPPLCERAVDIPLLAEAFLARDGNAQHVRFDDHAARALLQYRWPGNVAELEAVVTRARLVARRGVIGAADLALSGGDASLALAEVERRHIVAVLQANEWHQGNAAERLGISPKTLYRKIRQFGLRRPAGDADA